MDLVTLGLAVALWGAAQALCAGCARLQPDRSAR